MGSFGSIPDQSMNPGQDKMGDVNQSSEAHDKKNGSINEMKKSAEKSKNRHHAKPRNKSGKK